jgi:spermidine dehydrogenase
MSDRYLGLGRPITRRDFLNGASIAITGSLLPRELTAALQSPEYYPPALTGMRGSHEGSFEVAHRLRDQRGFHGSSEDTGEAYDLVVVGAGMSGLAAAFYFRKAAGANARILLLDNHDDFGGHAKRNEFRHGDRLLIGYGGTEQIYPGPSAFGPQARALLAEIGVDTDRFYQAFDQNLYSGLGLEQALYFDRETFGADRLVRGEGKLPWAEFLKKTPLSEPARADIQKLYEDPRDYFPGLSVDEKRARLGKMSYNDFLLNAAGVHGDVLPYFQTRSHRLAAIGGDARSALSAWRSGLPGFAGLGLGAPPESPSHEPHDIFHFPDGNASLARLFVRSLVPGAVPGTTMDDLVTSRVDYSRLDQPGANVRLRLNSTAVLVKHAGDPATAAAVEVTYVTAERASRVKAAHVILAGYHGMVPHVCPEMPEAQRKALAFAVRAPLVYTNVLVSNWTPWQKLGVHYILALNGYHTEAKLDFPVSLGGYRHPRTPDEPILLHLEKTPLKPGLPRREQHRAGRVELLSTPFETFELRIREQLARMLGEGGFDPERDIEAITVNRWPHGYATGRDPLTDPEWAEGEDPWSIARRPFGRIALASSDSGPGALTQVAFDQALRAVRELASS